MNPIHGEALLLHFSKARSSRTSKRGLPPSVYGPRGLPTAQS
jgi:hypothetical protein